MATTRPETAQKIPADIVVRDRSGAVSLVVEVRAPGMTSRPAQPESRLIEWAVRQDQDRPYFMMIDLDHIFIIRPEDFPWEGVPLGAARLVESLTLPTAAVLAAYDREFPQKARERRIYEYYLSALAEFWLRDLAYHWKLADPPGMMELAGIGLLPRIEGGTVQSEDVPDDDGLS